VSPYTEMSPLSQCGNKESRDTVPLERQSLEVQETDLDLKRRKIPTCSGQPKLEVSRPIKVRF